MATEHPTTRAIPRDPPPAKPAAAPEQHLVLEAEAIAAAESVKNSDDFDMVELGTMLAVASRAYHAFDRASLNATPSFKLTCIEAETILDDRCEALRLLISTLPPASLGDVAVLLAGAATIADRLGGCVYDTESVNEMADQIGRMLFGALPIVARAAGLDMAEMGWQHFDRLRIGRYAGVGVTS